MAKGFITRAYLEDTADAIRVLRGESDTYTPDEFGEKIIDAIPDVEVTDDIVSVTDAAAYPAEELEFAIEPVQDLHGYDKPWPGGGGKNLLNNVAVFGGSPNIYSVNNDADQTLTIVESDGRAWSAIQEYPLAAGTYTISRSIVTGNADVRLSTDGYGSQHSFTDKQTFTLEEDGAIKIKIGTSASSYPINNVKVMIELGTTATSYEPYSNICPISGWTGVNGERTGKNLLDINAVTSGAVDEDTGTVVPNSNNKVTPLIKCEPNTTYVLSGFSNNVRPKYYKSSIEYIGQATSTTTSTFTTSADCHFMRLQGSNAAWNNAVNPQCELGSTATSYEPYTGTSIPITFPTEAGTVYGGKVDVVNGKLRVDRLTKIYDGTENWQKSSSYEYYFYNDLSMSYKRTADVKVLSNTLKYVGTSANNGQFTLNTNYSVGLYIGGLNSNEIYIHLSGTTELLDLQQFLANNNLQLVYELAEPIEYDITPQQVQMLLGDNNVWCDTGDTTLEYKVDLGRYIEKLQASQATSQLSLSRQAVSLDAERDVEPITQEIKSDVSERKSAEKDEQEEQQQGVDED